MKKQNEVVIFEKFRIKPSQKEKKEIDALKMEFKETPIKTTGAMLFLAVATPFVGEGTSTLTLSVSSSTKGSSAETFSPFDLSHFETVASVIDSPSVGTVIFSAI